MRIQKILLDMDGVLSDFHKRYRELFHIETEKIRARGEKDDDNWNQFVEGKNFETLDWYPGGKELLKFVLSLDIPIEILSSSGGRSHHEEVKKQKKVLILRFEKLSGFLFVETELVGRVKRCGFFRVSRLFLRAFI